MPWKRRLKSALKWLYPGMRVKRWLFLTPIGVFLVIIGVTLITNTQVVDYLNNVANWVYQTSSEFLPKPLNLSEPRVYIPLSILFILVGLSLIFVSFRQVIASIASVISPQDKDRLADVIYKRRHLAQGHRMVVIGGGTGLSALLRGLKEHTSNIVAIVTVTDDGGSSGRLQRQFGMLPPGDIRNCLVALADAEPLMTELFQHRFDEVGDGLAGHSFGNLLIAAMTNITGDFERAIKETSNILAIRGRVLPSTLQNVVLRAEMEDGSILEGETNITKSPLAIKRISLFPEDVMPLDETLEAIRLANAIVVGPGSLYTSVIPNLLVKGMVEAIMDSDAVKIYVCNVMTQPGETNGYRASDHVKAIFEHTGKRIFNYVLVNKEVPSIRLLEKYQREGAELVSPDVDAIREMGYKPVTGNYISETEVVRHDPQKLAQAIIRLVFEKSFLPR
ncbi:MAG: YvcK family protein [Armatimonadetes bacterium]|nr:YvcK family protein [Armatimonadota bacterium]